MSCDSKEKENLNNRSCSNKNILWLHIPVDDTIWMQIMQCSDLTKQFIQFKSSIPKKYILLNKEMLNKYGAKNDKG